MQNIVFNKKLYGVKAIKSAIKEYQSLADFSFEQKGNYIWVKLKNIDEEISGVIKDEFCNYVLFKSKES